MKKHRKYIPHEVHFFLSMFSLGTMLLVIWNQYLNGPIGGDLELWNYIDPIVIFVLLLVTIFHIFEGIEYSDLKKGKKK